jgi:hypothetical protein
MRSRLSAETKLWTVAERGRYRREGIVLKNAPWTPEAKTERTMSESGRATLLRVFAAQGIPEAEYERRLKIIDYCLSSLVWEDQTQLREELFRTGKWNEACGRSETTFSYQQLE